MPSLRDFSPFLTPYQGAAERENASARTASVMGQIASDRRRDAIARQQLEANKQAQADTAAHYQRSDTLEATKETNRVAEQREQIARAEEEKRRQLAMSLIMEEDPAKQEALRNAASLYGIDVQVRDGGDQQAPQQTHQQAQQQTTEAVQQGVQQALQQRPNGVPAPGSVQQAPVPQQAQPPQLPQPAPLAQPPQAGYQAPVAPPQQLVPPIAGAPAQPAPVQQPDPNAQAIADARGSLSQFTGEPPPPQIDPLGPPQAMLDQPQIQQQPQPAAPGQVAPAPRPPPRIYDFSYKGKRFLSVDLDHLANLREQERKKALEAGVAGAPAAEREFYAGASTAVGAMPFLGPPAAVKAQQEIASKAAERAIDRDKAEAQAALAAETQRMTFLQRQRADQRADTKEKLQAEKWAFEQQKYRDKLKSDEDKKTAAAKVAKTKEDRIAKTGAELAARRLDKDIGASERADNYLTITSELEKLERAENSYDPDSDALQQIYMDSLYRIARTRDRGAFNKFDIESVPALTKWTDRAIAWVEHGVHGAPSGEEMQNIKGLLHSLKATVERQTKANYDQLIVQRDSHPLGSADWQAYDRRIQTLYSTKGLDWYGPAHQADEASRHELGAVQEGGASEEGGQPSDGLPPAPDIQGAAPGKLPMPTGKLPEKLPMVRDAVKDPPVKPSDVRRSKLFTDKVLEQLKQAQRQEEAQ